MLTVCKRHGVTAVAWEWVMASLLADRVQPASAYPVVVPDAIATPGKHPPPASTWLGTPNHAGVFAPASRHGSPSEAEAGRGGDTVQRKGRHRRTARRRGSVSDDDMPAGTVFYRAFKTGATRFDVNDTVYLSCGGRGGGGGSSGSSVWMGRVVGAWEEADGERFVAWVPLTAADVSNEPWAGQAAVSPPPQPHTARRVDDGGDTPDTVVASDDVLPLRPICLDSAVQALATEQGRAVRRARVEDVQARFVLLAPHQLASLDYGCSRDVRVAVGACGAAVADN